MPPSTLWSIFTSPSLAEPNTSTRAVAGTITVGLLFGLGQCVATFAITMAYARWANQKQDAVAENLREHIEQGTVLGDGAAAGRVDGSRA